MRIITIRRNASKNAPVLKGASNYCKFCRVEVNQRAEMNRVERMKIKIPFVKIEKDSHKECKKYIESAKRNTNKVEEPAEVIQYNSNVAIALSATNLEFWTFPVENGKWRCKFTAKKHQVKTAAKNSKTNKLLQMLYYSRKQKKDLDYLMNVLIKEGRIEPKDVTYLDISGLDLTSMPKNTYKFVNLKGIFLANNKIKELPNEIKSLKKLNWLNISSNPNIQISDVINELKHLSRLEINKDVLEKEIKMGLLANGVKLIHPDFE